MVQSTEGITAVGCFHYTYCYNNSENVKWPQSSKNQASLFQFQFSYGFCWLFLKSEIKLGLIDCGNKAEFQSLIHGFRCF